MWTTRIFVWTVVVLWLSPTASRAAVRFDGLTWYHSQDPTRLIINPEAHLEWVSPKAPDQVTVRLPEMDLSNVGDSAQIRYDRESACDEKARPGMKHVVVYSGPEIACGWPANHGVWCWDDGEILVGFSYGKFIERNGHNIDEDGATYAALARSSDGGETWEMENPDNFAGDGRVTSEPPGGINFAHRDFAMSVKCDILRGMSGEGESFWYSYDRGRTWRGPYWFGKLMSNSELAGMEFTARTDYVVNGSAECLIMMSARPAKSGDAIRKDKVFAARSTDGGKTFDFVSWVVGLEDPYRAVMPSTVRCSPTRLVSVIRRRAVPENTNWVDAYVSKDNGRTWCFSSRVGEAGDWNGNPPALARLRDGRLCCVYGSRSTRKILARLSKDGAATWDSEIVLRDDYHMDSFGEPDLGYPQLVQRPDGKLVAIYYWATKEYPQLHIAATIWEPGQGI
jgi:hypothetical protein